jgi:predicted DNA binding CopG/RHH family protein
VASRGPCRWRRFGWGDAMSVARKKRVNFLISSEELTMLKALARAKGLSVSDWIRQTVRAASGQPHL